MVRYYKATHEENFLSRWLREDKERYGQRRGRDEEDKKKRVGEERWRKKWKGPAVDRKRACLSFCAGFDERTPFEEMLWWMFRGLRRIVGMTTRLLRSCLCPRPGFAR